VLARHGIEIETVRGIGYRMTPESKAKWQALVDSANQQEAAA
jgi:biotin operon repressor